MVVVVAAFLPWAFVFGAGVSGIGGDGVTTLALAVTGVILLLTASGAIGSSDKVPERVADVALVVIGGLIALVGFINRSGFAAVGLYLTLFGGLVWAGCAAWQLAATPPGASDETAL